MSEFLTDDWFAGLASRAAGASVPDDLTLTIEQEITGDSGQRWQVRLADGRATIDRAATATADVRIVTDTVTAAGIQAGTVSAQRAFLDGRLRIGGDVQVLMDHREALAELGLGLA